MFGYTEHIKERSFCWEGSGGWEFQALGFTFMNFYNFFDVDTIIRIGSQWCITDNVNLYDIVIAQGVIQLRLL